MMIIAVPVPITIRRLIHDVNDVFSQICFCLLSILPSFIFAYW